jgi:hypothetical protein
MNVNMSLMSMVGILLLASSGLAVSKNDRERIGLIGPVRVVVEEISDKDKAVGAPWPNGSHVWWFVHNYDPTGRLTDSQMRTYTVGGRIGPLSKSVTTRDALGNLVVRTNLDEDGSIRSRVLSARDQNGNETAEAQYKTDGLLSRVTVFSYDKEQRQTSRTTFSWNPPSFEQATYTTDDQGNKITVEYINGAFRRKEVESFGSHGRRTGVVTYGVDGTILRKGVLKYDERDNIIESTSYRADGTVESEDIRTYEYDSVGNWIKLKKTERQNDRDQTYVSFSFRNITYY